MKRIILIATCAASISAYGLPTYEPFTEFASQTVNAYFTVSNGVTLGTNHALGWVSNAVDLTTGGFTAPGGETWTAMKYCSTNETTTSATGVNVVNGLDVCVISNISIFTYANVSSLLPAGFPGSPASGQAITNFVENPAQPLIWTGSSYSEEPWTIGNSAVLTFAQDITRPATGTKTLFISYLFVDAQLGATGPNNVGRYLGFLASSNLVEGLGTSGYYSNWNLFFNNFGTSGDPRYFGHGVLEDNGTTVYVGACDTSLGKGFSTSFTTAFNTPNFVVGAYVMVSTNAINSGVRDTNIMWVNPATGGFGGPNPPASPIFANLITNTMNDVNGMVLIDRPGNGASGGVGTNYIANLMLGTTWSYVTGGPEFTTQPVATTFSTPGATVNLSGVAVAAGQTVSYQWQHGGTNVNNGANGAGGAATVSGATSSALTLTGVSTGDGGVYQLVATASGTSFTLSSATATVVVADPGILAQPQSTTANAGGSASFSATIETTTASLKYAWYDGATRLNNGLQADNSTVSGATGTNNASGSVTVTLTLSNVSCAEDGTYTLVVTNASNSTNVTTGASLAVTDPYISVQPPALAGVATGFTTVIPVGANGTGLTYQWNWNNGNGANVNNGEILGSTTSALTISTANTANDAGTYSVTVSGTCGPAVTSANTVVETATVPSSVTLTPAALIQQAGTHLALVGTVAGGSGPIQLYLQLNGTNLANGTQGDGTTISGSIGTVLNGPGAGAFVLSNLHVLDSGTYTMIASNVAGTASASSVVTVTNGLLPLYTTNLVVTRVGDGSEALSGVTGNTLYLDQFTTNGGYVSTIMIPDSGSSAVIVPGAGADGVNEAYMTLSQNGDYLNFAGYCWSYPYTGPNTVTQGQQNSGGSTLDIRGIGAVNGLGYYVLAYTNYGLYSGGQGYIRDAYSTDGLTNFWTTGAAGGSAIKYVQFGSGGAGYATGSGVPGLSDSVAGSICLGQCGVNLVFSDNLLVGTDTNGILGVSGGSPPYPAEGLDIFSGTPESNPANGGATNMVFMGDPNDFIFSPDLQTVYVADSAPVTGGNSGNGGVQRYDLVGGAYTYAYNLYDTASPNGTNGLRGLTASFPPGSTGSGNTGAIIYATTSEAVSNRLIQITDNGNGSGSTTLSTAGPNQVIRGVRFAPATVPITFPTPPQGTSTYVGQSDTLTVTVNGDAPLSYQWQFDGTNIAGATGTSLALVNLQTTNSGTYTVVVSDPVSTNSSSAVVSVSAGPPVLLASPQSRVETVGDHLAFTVFVTGTLPLYYQWLSNGTPIAGATTSAYNLSSIVVADSASYSVTYSNQFGTNTSSSATLKVTTSLQSLSSNNLVVARVGDGAEALSDSTGNTLYLDQFTTAGVYSNTIMIPDDAATNLIVAGGPVSGVNESVLNLSTNTWFLNFCGYDTAYPNTSSPPFNTASSNPGAGTVFRSIGAVNAFGYYTTAQVNETAYVASPYDFESAVSLDGLNEFWTTGFASAGGVKYLVPSTAGAAGGNYGAGGSGLGTRVVQIINGNVVYTDLGVTPIGIYGFAGEPTAANPLSSANLLTDAAGNPNDFAASPDTTAFPPTTSTVYVCDSSSIASGGGIQRYDWNGSAYALSYTLGTGVGSTVGASCLAVDFSANATWGASVTGAKIYATTAGSLSNSLIKITDMGAGSSATVLATANPNEILRGVRFGPAVQPLAFVPPPTSQSAVVGQEVDFTASVAGSGPITYQWNYNSNPISGATNSSYSIPNVQMTNAGSYTITATSPGASLTSTPAAVLTVNSFSASSSTLPLVGWWILNDGPSGANSGTTAVDSSSYGDNGALNNFADVSGAEWVSPGLGSYSYALNFDDANTAGNNVVVVPDATQLNFSNNLAFTLAAWVNLASAAQTNGAGIIAKGIGSGGEQYTLDLFTNAGVLNFRFYVRNAAGQTLAGTPIYGGPPTIGTWEHVAATYDGYSGIMAIYTNGVLANETTVQSSSLFYTTSPVTIGNRILSSANPNYALPVFGKMQDARIYDVALGQQDIQAIYTTLAPVNSTPPQFTTNGAGPITFTGPGTGQLNFSGTANATYRIWSTTNLYISSSTPVDNSSNWTLVGSGTFSGGADSFPISTTNKDTFYVITHP